MSILVIGGAGFIGRRMVPILVAAGHEVTCVDIDVAGATAAFEVGGSEGSGGDVTHLTTSSAR
jgi:nucleoside-diphosphate-sugar epimerase